LQLIIDDLQALGCVGSKHASNQAKGNPRNEEKKLLLLNWVLGAS